MADSPAWMICEDLISRIREELMSEAIDILHKEIEAGRIKVDGNLVTSEEASNETERDVFILNKLIEDEPNLRLRYENMVNAVESGKEENPDVVARLEEVKKFLLVVSQISLTMKYARTFSEWFDDAAKRVNIKDPAEILYVTAADNGERKEALGFVIQNKAFVKNEALKKEEFEIIKEAYDRCVEV